MRQRNAHSPVCNIATRSAANQNLEDTIRPVLRSMQMELVREGMLPIPAAEEIRKLETLAHDLLTLTQSQREVQLQTWNMLREISASTSDYRRESLKSRYKACLSITPVLTKAMTRFDADAWVEMLLKAADKALVPECLVETIGRWGPHVSDATKDHALKTIACDLPRYHYANHIDQLLDAMGGHPDLHGQLNHSIKASSKLAILARAATEQYRGNEWAKVARSYLPAEVEQGEYVLTLRHPQLEDGGMCRLRLNHLKAFQWWSRSYKSYGWGWWAGAYGEVTAIYSHGKLIGSLKHAGMPTVLAMRTMQDSSGKYPLVLGGLYATTKHIVRMAQDANEQQGRWSAITIDSLPLYPLGFIFNDYWNTEPEMLRKSRSDIVQYRSTLQKKSQAKATLGRFLA